MGALSSLGQPASSSCRWSSEASPLIDELLVDVQALRDSVGDHIGDGGTLSHDIHGHFPNATIQRKRITT